MASPRPFRFGVVAAQAPSADAWTTMARRAEELGFSTFLIPDTLGPTLSPVPALTAAAVATRTIRVGSYVFANDLRNPVLLSKAQDIVCEERCGGLVRHHRWAA